MRPWSRAGALNAWSAWFLISIALLAISSPLILHSTSLVSLGAQNDFEAVPPTMVGNTNGIEKRCAYVFYVSDDAYACSALVNMARLQPTLPRDVDLIMIAFDSVFTSIRDVATKRLGALVHNTSNFGKEYDMGIPIGQHREKYRHCFLKFLAFLLPSETYRRLIMMDADSLVLHPPHHLFDLPDELPLAVPSAYWLRPQFVSVTNWFMSVSRQQLGNMSRKRVCTVGASHRPHTSPHSRSDRPQRCTLSCRGRSKTSEHRYANRRKQPAVLQYNLFTPFATCRMPTGQTRHLRHGPSQRGLCKRNHCLATDIRVTGYRVYGK